MPPEPKTVVGRISRREMLALLSFTMALTALSIDLMLPAFGEIRSAFGLDPDSSETARIVTVYMLGLAAAQVFYGPLSDRFGRKPVLYGGFAVYALGALGAALAPTFGLLLASRLLWGVGAAGARVISVSIIRDTHSGDRMARTMSFIMAVFIVVPILSPTVGAAIVSVAPWRAVFWFCVVYVAAVAMWAIRLPETLDPARRMELSFGGVKAAARFVLGNRVTVGYAAAMTVVFAGFISYLATSELIVEDVFDMGDRFPLIFGGFAAVMGITMLMNASVVMRLGARRIVRWVSIGYVAGSLVLLMLALAADGRPGFWVVAIPLGFVLCMHALLTPNLNSLAMEPMGPVAGTASALIGTLQTGLGAVLGSFIDRAYDGTVTPLGLGLLASGLLAFVAIRWAGASPNDEPGARRLGSLRTE